MGEIQLTIPFEEWLPIPGYEGWYSVSNYGRIRRDKSFGITWAGRILRQSRRGDYLKVTLCKYPIKTQVSIHTMVARAFLGPCPEGHEVNHKNGIKSDNRDSNLEYVTPSQNSVHAYELGLSVGPVGEKHHMCKLTEIQVLDIRARRSAGDTLRQLAAEYMVSISAICDIVHRRNWRHI